MNLVIVESPSKATTIKKYLGKGFIVKASKGHVVDLPKSQLGINVENNFEPEYVVTKPEALKDLKKAYKESDKLILAVDLDREGEAIGWHVAQKLGAIDKNGKAKKGKKVERIVFNEITKDAIQEAIKEPRELNMDLINAQQARRFLDRLVGYKLSPVLWKKITFGLSAGRVQSAALRLIVDREEERRKFKPVEYWSIDLYAAKTKSKDIIVNIQKKDEEVAKRDNLANLIKFEYENKTGKDFDVKEERDAKNILEEIKGKDVVISEVNKKNYKKYPKPPFITSTLQQTAVNTLGFSSKRTMMIAQKLYEKGYITYMRTDSVSMSNQAITAARNYIKKEYGEKYLPEKANFYKSSNKNAQEAHECIRPVDFTKSLEGEFDNDHIKLYNLIKNRTLASQSVPAELEGLTIKAKVSTYGFKATGSTMLFNGYLKISGDKISETVLPKVEKGEIWHQNEINAIQHFTQPIARFSEASLIKELEKLGIGRPSTYSSIISTIIARKYVEKENKYLFPTDIGEVVNKLLVKYFPNIVDLKFTAEMEDSLDNIAEGKLDWLKMLKDFYFPFEKEVVTNDKKITREEFTVLGDAPSEIKCPECGSKMIIKLGRYGRFYSCSKYPECKGILSGTDNDEDKTSNDTNSEEFKSTYKSAPKTEDGREYILKNSRFGKFWAHPDYPKVKDSKPLEYTDEKLKELFGNPPKTQDKTDYILKKGKFGYFWAHPDYPKVKDIINIKKSKDK